MPKIASTCYSNESIKIQIFPAQYFWPKGERERERENLKAFKDKKNMFIRI